MAHTHEYDCIVCGAHFDSQNDLVRHNEQQHIQTASGTERPRQSPPREPDLDREERGRS